MKTAGISIMILIDRNMPVHVKIYHLWENSKKKKKSTVNYFNNQSLKSKHSGLLTFQGYHSPSLHQLPYYWYKVTALEKKNKKNNTIKQLIHFMKKGMYLICRV